MLWKIIVILATFLLSSSCSTKTINIRTRLVYVSPYEMADSDLIKINGDFKFAENALSDLKIKFKICVHEHVVCDEAASLAPNFDWIFDEADQYPNYLSIYYFPIHLKYYGVTHLSYDNKCGIFVTIFSPQHVLAHELGHHLGQLLHSYEDDGISDTPYGDRSFPNIMNTTYHISSEQLTFTNKQLTQLNWVLFNSSRREYLEP